MSLEDFKSSLEEESPPPSLTPLLKALWYEGNGNWQKAHELAQDVNSTDGAWVHAYLHRKEGDVSNADYWYRKAKKKMPDVSLFEEWEEIVAELLGRK
jgi:hypothetical protein